MWLSEGVSPCLALAMGSYRVQIEGCKMDAFGLTSLNYQGVAASMLIKADRVVGHRMSIGIWRCIVGQSDTNHIFVGTCAQLAETIGLHLTSIGDQNYLSPL